MFKRLAIACAIGALALTGLGFAIGADATGNTCTGYEHKVDGLSGFTYTITPDPGEHVTEWCVKFSTSKRTGTGNFIDISDQKHEISHVAWNDEPDPTPTPTPTPTQPTATVTITPTPTVTPTPTDPTVTPTPTVTPSPTEPTMIPPTSATAPPTEPTMIPPTSPPGDGKPPVHENRFIHTCAYVYTVHYVDGKEVWRKREATGAACGPGSPYQDNGPAEEGM